MNQITQNIAGAYIGAQVVESDGLVGVLTGTNITYLTVRINGEFYDFDYGQCRLILTPISAISDEDAVEVAKIINAHHPHSECLKFDYSLVKLGYQVEANYSSSLFNYDVTDYLRSDKRPDGITKPVYDLGYMGIRSLIAAGIAISSTDKTETK